MSITTVTDILLAAAPYVVPILVTILFAVAQAIKTRQPINQRALLGDVVHQSVTAVEQMADTTLNGPGKKQLAVEMIEKQLASYHINVPASVINTAVESAVFALNQMKPAK